MVNNLAGGVISSNGDAVAPTGSLTLTNAGTINGKINLGTLAGTAVLGGVTFGSTTVDSRAGTINGNLVVGYGPVTLLADYVNGAVVTGINGAIVLTAVLNPNHITMVDGSVVILGPPIGGNTLKLNYASDATLNSAITLPASFGNLTNVVASGATLTLGSGYATSQGLTVEGAGTVVNNANVSTAYQVFNGSGSVSLVNKGTLASTASGVVAVQLAQYGGFTNTGTVFSNQAAVNGYGTSFSNSGTITSAGAYTGVNITMASNFANSGTIASGGTAVALSGGNFGTYTNSGTFAGGTGSSGVGLSLSQLAFTNAGTIRGNTAVSLDSWAILINQAGGTITARSQGASAYAINTTGTWNTVVNAGTIYGNVNLANLYTQYYGYGSTYVAKAGGTLTGTLTLRLFDALVTQLSGAGSSGYAGINGAVAANGSTLRYDVTANASDTLAAHTGFATLGYQLSNNATLSLAAQGSYGQAVYLAGTGQVVNTATLATTNTSALVSTSVVATGAGSVPATALVIANGGNLSMLHSGSAFYPQGTVVLGASDTLSNTGAISLVDTVRANTLAAVVGGASIVNSGQITATGGYGVAGSSSYDNTITNSGTIRSDMAALVLGYRTSVINSGTLVSTGGAALLATNGYSAGASITNLAGGTITGVGTAIALQGGTLSNAGTINGNVDMAGNGYYAATYIAKGGTINGNLTFGNGSDVLVETGSGYGVTGAIDGGAGNNWVQHVRSGTASVALGQALPTHFTYEATVTGDAASQITLTGPAAYASAIYVGGSGTIINTAATSGELASAAMAGSSQVPMAYLARLSNRANVGSVTLYANAFDNSANGITFANTGTSANRGSSAAVAPTRCRWGRRPAPARR